MASGWQLHTSNGLHASPADIDSHSKELSSGSDDDLPLSSFVETNSLKCDKCGSLFSNLSDLRDHFEKYKHEHSYCSRCNAIKDAKHKCRGSNCSGINTKTDSKMKIGRKAGKQKNIDKPCKCEECPRSFRNGFALNVHMRCVHKTVIRKCPTCEETLKSEEEYASHISMHGPEDKIICKNCRAEFSTMKQYRTHAKQYPAPHNFRCNFCLRTFMTETRLEDHTCICINGQPLLCACGETFSTYASVVEHARGSKPFKCCTCIQTSTSLRSYIAHVRKHSQQMPYNCVKCSIRFPSLEIWKSHMKNVHGEDCTLPGNQMCLVCGTIFECPWELQQHLNTHNEQVPCPDCGKMVRTHRLEVHRVKHSRSSLLCPDCGKLFDSHFRYTQHIKSAHINMPVSCDLCGKALKTKKILAEHLKTHLKTEIGTRVAQAICPICGLKLAQKGSLGRHILLVHERHRLVVDDQPVMCKECGAMLPNKAKYYTHRRQHRAMIERFPCFICLREFNKKQNLVRHMHLIHDSKRKIEDPSHNCELCPRIFRERKNLHRHYRAVHRTSVMTT